jgi:hypothetical protein
MLDAANRDQAVRVTQDVMARLGFVNPGYQAINSKISRPIRKTRMRRFLAGQFTSIGLTVSVTLRAVPSPASRLAFGIGDMSRQASQCLFKTVPTIQDNVTGFST